MRDKQERRQYDAQTSREVESVDPALDRSAKITRTKFSRHNRGGRVSEKHHESDHRLQYGARNTQAGEGRSSKVTDHCGVDRNK